MCVLFRELVVLVLSCVVCLGLSPRGTPRGLTEALTSRHAPSRFVKDFSKPSRVPEAGVEAAVGLMRSGRLGRYGASSAASSEVSRAEVEFAASVAGRSYAVGVNSCSSALMLGLMAVGVKPGDRVLTNGLAHTSVPSSVMRLGAEPVLVDTVDWRMDLDDLEAKRSQFPDARVLLLSHAMGQVCDLDRVKDVSGAHGLAVVEDCGDAAGATWKGRPVGSLGDVAAFSVRSDRVLNGGEGGFAVTDDPEVAAKLVFLSGCSERRYGKHASRPEDDDLLERAMVSMPNLGARMSELNAAVLRPQIEDLRETVRRARRNHALVAETLADLSDAVVLPAVDDRAAPVGDRLAFSLKAPVDDAENALFRTTCVALGVPVSWLRSPVNARYHANWRKYGAPAFDLPHTDALLQAAYDLRLPDYFDADDFVHLATIIAYAANFATGADYDAEDAGGREEDDD